MKSLNQERMNFKKVKRNEKRVEKNIFRKKILTNFLFEEKTFW